MRSLRIAVTVLALWAGWFSPKAAAAGEATTAREIGQYIAARFEPGEGWSARASGDAGATRLEGRKLIFDFTTGATALTIAPPDRSLLGTPREFRIRVRGKAAGHPVRFRLATHFMTFERTIGELARDGENELVVPAPPGEGWRWYGGENDGKIHGPLRITGITLDRNDHGDRGQLELLEIAVTADYPAQRACVLVAETRETPAGRSFAAILRNTANKPIEGTLAWTIRDWEGKTLHLSQHPVKVPAAGVPLEVAVPMPAGAHEFLEAEALLEAEGQITPPAQACYVAPIVSQEEPSIDPSSPFGMGLYLNRYPGDAEGLKTMDCAAKLAAEAGVKWSREDIHWSRIEPRRGEYDWRYYDALVATAKRHGISIYGLLGGWAPYTKPYTPEGIDDYCRFATAAVEHYRQDIHHWEVWNEPNIFFWQGPRDMYAELLKKGYAAIKKADPKANVLGCSTAGIDQKFIKRVMELEGPFDILTIHPYRTKLDDAAFLKDLRSVGDLVKRPDGSVREVWITEMGWPTYVLHNSLRQDFQPVTQRQQATLLARSYIGALASGVSPNISWYDFRNDGYDPLNFEHNMGIVTRDFRIKPAYRALATLTRTLKGLRIAEELKLGDGVIAYRFADPAGRRSVIALWGVDADHAVQLPASRAGTMIDLMGRKHGLTPEQGIVRLTAQAAQPAFIEAP